MPAIDESRLKEMLESLQSGALTVDEALARLRTALERLKSEAPQAPNVIFGPLTHNEWIALNLRHAELHLGFQVPEQ